jgi:hypothetical protein
MSKVSGKVVSQPSYIKIIKLTDYCRREINKLAEQELLAAKQEDIEYEKVIDNLREACSKYAANVKCYHSAETSFLQELTHEYFQRSLLILHEFDSATAVAKLVWTFDIPITGREACCCGQKQSHSIQLFAKDFLLGRNSLSFGATVSPKFFISLNRFLPSICKHYLQEDVKFYEYIDDISSRFYNENFGSKLYNFILTPTIVTLCNCCK